MPWYLIPLNIYYCFCAVWYSLTDSRFSSIASFVKRQTGATLVTCDRLVLNPVPDLKILVASRPEIDFPLVVPPQLTPCGPIIRRVPPVAEIDPDLDAWLRSGPTVFVNLGTHAVMDEAAAVEMAGALRVLLDRAASPPSRSGNTAGLQGRLQVLWKLKKNADADDYEFATGSALHDILGKELDADIVRIVEWVAPEPIAVLETGNVVCAVNHGGANSFHEAV